MQYETNTNKTKLNVKEEAPGQKHDQILIFPKTDDKLLVSNHMTVPEPSLNEHHMNTFDIDVTGVKKEVT